MNIAAEDYVRQKLVNSGFVVNVKKEDAKGIDIIAIKNGQSFLIEVKKVIEEKDETYKIKTHKLKVDFVIAVFDNGYILPMSFNKCGKNSFSLTKIGRFIKLFTEQK